MPHPTEPPKDPLVAAGLHLEIPSGFTAADVAPAAAWKHVRAARSTDVEVRYGLAPQAVTDQLRAACGDRERCVPSARTIDDLLRTAATGLGANVRVTGFPLDAVRVEFDALWGGVAGFDVDPAFAPGGGKGVAVVLHRDHTTAMFVGLFPASAQDEWMTAFHSLKFARPFAVPGQASTLVGTRWKCGDGGFTRMRFEATTWSVIHISVAMAAMGGPLQPFETIYNDVTYLSDTELEATPFRIDNMEAGDRTPKDPKPRRVTYARSGDQLTIDGTTCTLVRR